MQIRVTLFAVLMISCHIIFPAEQPKKRTGIVSIDELNYSLSKEQADKEKAKVQRAINDFIEKLSLRSVDDIGYVFELYVSSEKGSLFRHGNNMELLLQELMKLSSEHFDDDKKIAIFSGAEMWPYYGARETVDLASIHKNVLALIARLPQHAALKSLILLIGSAITSDPNPFSMISGYIERFFGKPTNRSKYLVYQFVHLLEDSTIDDGYKINIIGLLKNKVSSEDFAMQRWLKKIEGQVRAKPLLRTSILLPFLYRPELSPNTICTELYATLTNKKLQWDHEWATVLPIIRELSQSLNSSQLLMVLFTLDIADSTGNIKTMPSSWIANAIKGLPINDTLVKQIENACPSATQFYSETSLTREIKRCLPLLKTLLDSIKKEQFLDTSYMYWLMQNILLSTKLSAPLKGYCITHIGSYYSDNNLWDNLMQINPDFEAWMEQQVEDNDTITWLRSESRDIFPTILSNLPHENEWKDSIRSLFDLTTLQKDYDELSQVQQAGQGFSNLSEYRNALQKSFFKAVRLMGIARSLGFTIYTLHSRRYVDVFIALTDPWEKDPQWNLILRATVKEGKISPANAAILTSHYKIHLMPKEDDTERMTIDLMNEIKNNKILADAIITFKVKMMTEKGLFRSGVPRIIIYVTGKQNAQNLLNEIFRLFGPHGKYKYEAAGRAPFFNQKVTDLLYFAQGDRDDKLDPEYDTFYAQPTKIYYAPTIFGDGKEHDFTLTIPQS